MYPYRLPLKFIGLWVLNLAILLMLGIGLGLNDAISQLLQSSNMRHVLNTQEIACLYLIIAAVLALLEQALWDKLRGE